MKLTKLFKTVCLCGVSLLAFSCDSSNSYTDTPEAVPVRSVRIESNLDLASRSDWKLYVHGYQYPFTIEEGKLIATPATEKETFMFSTTSTNKQGYAMIKFMPENYLKTRQALPGGGGSTIVANLEKQGTLENFKACDVLYYEFTGIAKEDLHISQLQHENALLRFATIDLPEDAKIYVRQRHDQKITPFKLSETEYQAIIFPDNFPDTVIIEVEANGKRYENNLLSSLRTRKDVSRVGIGHSVAIEFTVGIVDDRLTIKVISSKYYSGEWPITQ